jgi:hypothetical protein
LVLKSRYNFKIVDEIKINIKVDVVTIFKPNFLMYR